MALAFCMPQLRAMDKPDFEKLLPIVLTQQVPAGVIGLLLAGLLAAFMSNFAATINAAPAYVVNDIYRRFIRPNSSARAQVRLSRAASVVVLIVGISLGLLTTRITSIMLWIVGALYGGYVVSNVLKWYWWRFNGYGYFWGMVGGIVSAISVPTLAEKILGESINPLYTFPVIFVVSLLGCLLGTLLTRPEDTIVLERFYRTVRPWGFWGPIRARVMAQDPTFQPNREFPRDITNVLVGILWQVSLAALPVYIVLRDWSWAGPILAFVVAASIFLKYRWYDRLERV